MRDWRKPIVFMGIKETNYEQADKEKFEFRPDRGWKWVQRAAFWLLAKIGAFHLECVTAYTREPSANDDLLTEIFKHEVEWKQRAFDGEQLQIFIGPDEQSELLELAHKMGMHPFPAGSGWIQFGETIAVRSEPGGFRRIATWHNMPIYVIPWIKGVVILPAGRR